MSDKDDIDENALADAVAAQLQASLDHEQTLRQNGDPERLALDARLLEIQGKRAAAWADELVQTGEAAKLGKPFEDRPRRPQPSQRFAAE